MWENASLCSWPSFLRPVGLRKKRYLLACIFSEVEGVLKALCRCCKMGQISPRDFEELHFSNFWLQLALPMNQI